MLQRSVIWPKLRSFTILVAALSLVSSSFARKHIGFFSWLFFETPLVFLVSFEKHWILHVIFEIARYLWPVWVQISLASLGPDISGKSECRCFCPVVVQIFLASLGPDTSGQSGSRYFWLSLDADICGLVSHDLINLSSCILLGSHDISNLVIFLAS